MSTHWFFPRVDCFVMLIICGISLTLSGALASAASNALSWTENGGVSCITPWAQVDVDRSERQRGPVLRFLGSDKDVFLVNPRVTHPGSDQLRLEYQAATPGGHNLLVSRHLKVQRGRGDLALVESFELRPDAPIQEDLEIVRPFSILPPRRQESSGANCEWTTPLKNGWARRVALAVQPNAAEYRLGHWIGGAETPELALPAVEVDTPGEWQGAVFSDPRFSAQFSVWTVPQSTSVSGELRYRYAGTKVPLSGSEMRQFGFWIRPATGAGQPFGQSVDAFFRLMLPDVPPGPQWLHEIYMVGYDFLSDNGQGWEADIRSLAGWLKPGERRHVALCLHGWYDALGTYSFDEANHRLKEHWTAMARTRKVGFSPEELRRRLRLAHAQGFRVLLYFGDGLAADSGVPGYHDDWAFQDAQGKKISGWQGPDTFGPTYLMNAAHPGVRRHFLDYLDALLHAVGRDVDGFVWDETFHARAGQVAFAPQPAYCGRAMLDLVKELTARVRSFNKQKVFLASDCVGIAPGIPGYAMVASGLYQDTHCNPERWSDALFPNWRNTYWSCNWGPVSHFEWTRFGVEQFGAPVAISNGWEEDYGPHEWKAQEREEFLNLFRHRLARGPAHVRYLSEDPVKLVAERGPDNALASSDPVPEPRPGEVNWALTSKGAQARASSEHRWENHVYPASGAIDGSRGDQGWGAGHGWASASGAALPQWLEVEFDQPRPISRFVVATYQAPGESARRWGVVDYTIEVWDASSSEWRTVARENRERILFTRVHSLPTPVTAKKFRVLVTRVAPMAGGIARLLQVEAWGPGQ